MATVWARQNAAGGIIVALAVLLLLAQWRVESTQRDLDATLRKLAAEQQHVLKLKRKVRPSRASRLTLACPAATPRAIASPSRLGLASRSALILPPPKVQRFALPDEAQQPAAGAARATGGPPALFPPGGSDSAVSATELLEGHRRWDWRAIATDVLQRWPSVEKQQLETAVKACANNGTMYCQRLQVRP
jgi:hypothetical protein